MFVCLQDLARQFWEASGLVLRPDAGDRPADGRQVFLLVRSLARGGGRRWHGQLQTKFDFVLSVKRRNLGENHRLDHHDSPSLHLLPAARGTSNVARLRKKDVMISFRSIVSFRWLGRKS